MSKWYTAQGNNSDVVVSSKIRLARNLADAPFPSRMSNEVRKMVCKKIFASIKILRLPVNLFNRTSKYERFEKSINGGAGNYKS